MPVRIGGAPGASILTSNRPALPTPSRLESAVAALAARGDQRNVIRLVEVWNEVGEPTRRARLAQARAFLELCMPDRAWIRLKDLVDGPEADVEALELAGRLFLKRGWPARARRPLERALAITAKDPTLERLLRQTAMPATEPELDGSDDPAEILRAAEVHLCTGSLLRGRSLLERLRREHPGGRRVDDLLWALEGDFAFEGEPSLAELAERFGPDLGTLAELSEEVEHTESITLQDVVPPQRDPVDTAFPTLFRSAEDTGTTTDAFEEHEVTRATSLADLASLRSSVEAARRSAGIVSGEEDTQIRRVIRRDDETLDLTDAGEELHLHRSMPEQGSFDLAGYRRDMGVEEAPPPPSDVEAPLEDEDDELIVLTRRERESRGVAIEPGTTFDGAPHPDAARFLAEAERLRRLEREALEQREEPDPASETATVPPRPVRRRRPAPSSTPMWLLVLAGLLGVLTVFLGVLVAVQFLAT